MNKLQEIQKTANKDIMRALHVVCGFDFQKPYYCETWEGNYTENKIKKYIGEWWNPDNKVILLVNTPGTIFGAKEWKIVELLEKGVNIEMRPHGDQARGYYFRNESFGYYWSKGEYNDARKDISTNVIILVQSRNDLVFPKELEPNMAARMEVVNVRMVGAYNSGDSWVGSVDAIPEGQNGKEFTIETGWNYTRSEDRIRDICDYIDKSGYLLTGRRSEMRRKANVLRSERRKAQVDAISFEATVEELESMIISTKKKIVEALEAAETVEEVRAVENALGYWNGYANVIRNFAKYKELAKTNGFDSVDDESSRRESITSRIVEIKNTLKEGEAEGGKDNVQKIS